MIRHQDAALVVKTVLAGRMNVAEPDVTVGVALPDDYKPAKHGDIVVVATDGGPDRVAAAWHTIRLTAWSARRSRAVELADTAYALLRTHNGTGGMQRPRPGTLTLVDRDPRTDAYIAGNTLTAPIRPR
ncbi:hypothetical protein [Tomitella fengzijianii]|uniref:Uncharacterized protein n=1 Tax=Tomitella fengzijianii TaxID=2597660 RepID=A0A516X4K6_9ACTN|nr:hypothetical protein [Tomitella fengzijianii]QDQ97980.1 hypothetical protein FO059_12465 [Tomitella fengzijianii]